MHDSKNITKLTNATRKMESALAKAKRGLFEYETMSNALEIHKGDFAVFDNVKDLLNKVKK